jgi:hypothetical protein
LKNELLDEKYLPFQISANCPVLIFMPLLISAIGISRLYDKNSESDFCFPPPKSEYFLQQHWESEYFFRKKNITPTPFKLNGRSLRT